MDNPKEIKIPKTNKLAASLSELGRTIETSYFKHTTTPITEIMAKNMPKVPKEDGS